MKSAIDIILIVVFVLIVIRSSRRGITLTLLDIAGAVLAFAVAKVLSLPVAAFIYDRAVKERLLVALTEKYGSLTDSVSFSAGKGGEILNLIPEGVNKYISSSGFTDPETIKKAFNSNISVVSEIESKFLSPLVQNVISILFFAICTSVLVFLFHIVSKRISKAVGAHSALKKVDSVFGAFFGVFKGAFYVLLIAVILNLSVMVFPDFAVWTNGSEICKFASGLVKL